MNDKPKPIDEIPEEFASLEDAAEFWDAHDTTDYLESFETVQTEAKLERRRFEVEIDADLMPALTEQAHNRGVQISRLVSDLLRERIRSI
ncbi:MAG: BrnA antitoxin family protein [Acidobacteria bacterium]|nr:BrnA antitoxin family protein [Acidobacteriota bacterium]MCA1639806.1 BrnA antitoxin family protein [Acidobacteriota bacterium]